MNEQEWMECTDPQPMLEFLRGKASDRKLRLFAVSCCRCVLQILPDERSRRSVEIVEQNADGLANVADQNAAANFAFAAAFAADLAGSQAVADAAHAVLSLTCGSFDPKAVARYAAFATDAETEREVQCKLLRDIFGIPCPAVTINPDWLIPGVMDLASDIYEQQAFDRLPILADALEDAGCDNSDILAHCRGPGPHVRGCWAVDAILGKT